MIILAVAAIVGIGSPPLDRWVLRRRRIQYQVVYNSKIGLDTVLQEHDEDEESSPKSTNPLGRLVHELERLSVVIIRIRNTGTADIEEPDVAPPLSVAFGNRVIWNARVSEASTRELRAQLRANMEFFTHSGWLTQDELNAIDSKRSTGYDYRNLSEVRRWLVRRRAGTLTQAPDEPPAAEPEPQWHGIRVANLGLRRQQQLPGQRPDPRCANDSVRTATTGDVVNTVRTVPGAIGYADIANQATKNALTAGQVVPVSLDGRATGVQSLPHYPFWTVEYLYTWTPGTRSPISAFVDYLKSDPVQDALRAAGYTPCVAPCGSLNPLCTQR
jgi:hypothetical protein